MSGAGFSRPLIVATVPDQGLTIEIVADEAERATVAAENDVISIERLNARLEIRSAAGGAYTVRGTVDALVTRKCVVTLEPFVETIAEQIEARFAPEDATPDPAEDEDVPEDRIVGGVIDLGAIAAEFFVLGLDPYPRKPGASFDAAAAGGDETGSPFAALRALKPRSDEAG